MTVTTSDNGIAEGVRIVDTLSEAQLTRLSRLEAEVVELRAMLAQALETVRTIPRKEEAR